MDIERTGFKATVDMRDVIPRDGKWHTLEVRYNEGVFEYFLNGKGVPRKILVRDPDTPNTYKEYDIEE